MVIKIRHEPPSQRRGYRVTFPIEISMAGDTYQSLDWSTTGIRIGGFDQKTFQGQRAEAKITIPFQGYDFSFYSVLEVVDVNPKDGEITTEFVNLGTAEQDVLKTFVSGILSGEMEEISGILRRVDVPVTPASLKADKPKNPEEIERRRQKGINFYIGFGAALTLIFLIVIYTNVFQVKVESSIVLAPTDTIIAPTAGDITYIAESAPNIVKIGDPIVKMTDPRLERDIQLAALKVLAAEQNTRRAGTAYNVEASRVESSKGIVSKEYAAVTQTVRSLETNLELKKAAVERGDGLIASGFISQNRLDQIKSEYLDVERQLNEARQTQAKLAETLSSVKRGFQVQDSRVQGGMADLDALKKSAVEAQAIAQTELEFLQGQRERLNIRATADGKIARTFLPVGASVKYGDPITMFEKQGERFVQAYLTHEEALSVKIGDSADVYFPYLWISTSFKVKDIDYYSLSVSETMGKFMWLDDNKFRAVVVVLEAKNDTARNKISKVSPGTAATVIFSRLF